MRIGIDGREFVRGKSTGTGRYLKHLLSYGPRQRPDWDFFVFLHHRCEFRHPSSHVFVQKVPQVSSLVWDQAILPFFLRQFKIDLFLNPYPKFPLLSGRPMALVINDLASCDPLFATDPVGRLKNLYFRALMKRAARRARRLLTISEYSKSQITSFLGIAPNKIDTVPLAVEDRYSPSDHQEPDRLRRYGIQSPYLLYVGDIRSHKNVSLCLESYAGLPASLRKQYCLVVGGSWNTGAEPLQRQTVQLGIEERVRFCGFVSEEDLPFLYAQAALFVYPSLYEGFGLPPLEAMACGIPVICSNRTSLPEVVGDGGLLLDPDDRPSWTGAIQRLLADEAERRRWAEKGRERARAFTPERTAEQFLRSLEGTVTS